MPYVGPLTSAWAFWCSASTPIRKRGRNSTSSRSAGVRSGSLRSICCSRVVLATVLPQLLYLFSRNLTLQLARSAARLPAAPRRVLRRFRRRQLRPAGQRAVSPPAAGRTLLPAVGSRARCGARWRACCSGSTAGSDASGACTSSRPGTSWRSRARSRKARRAWCIPLFVACVYVGATGAGVISPRLELPAFFLLLVACVCLPWYVQMYVRHGTPFTDGCCSTTCTSARSCTCTTPTPATTSASAITSGSSATRCSRGWA